MARKKAVADSKQQDTSATKPVSVWAQSPEVADALSELLMQVGSESEALLSGVDALVDEHGSSVYVELLYLLAHLQFRPPEAKRHWERITELQGSMQERMGTPVDLRVALVGYFVNVNRRLKNPKVIELKLFQETQASAYRDELTGLYNYRYFREHLPQELERYDRYNTPLSLAMVDIDDFKHYNDHSGHEEANGALSKVAQILLTCVRGVDTAVRYGGEEFALVLPSTGKEGAFTVAERACKRVAQHRFPMGELQPDGKLTVSIGVATYPADAKDADELVRHADQAMYVAKSRGKNQVFLFGSDRRSYRRIEATLQGSYCVVQAEYLPFSTVNVSEGGFLLLVDRKLRVGALIDVQLVLPGTRGAVGCTGRAVRVVEHEEGRYEAAMRIVSISQADRRRLNRYIRAEEPQVTAKPEG